MFRKYRKVEGTNRSAFILPSKNNIFWYVSSQYLLYPQVERLN